MSRGNIYYWKCDRPAAFHGIREQCRSNPELDLQVRGALKDYFQAESLHLTTGSGQGNHLTWNAEIDGLLLFIRVENGPEGDAYLEMESQLLRAVTATGVPAPQVYGCDASRTHVPFAWQALEYISYPDLNHWFKQGNLDGQRIAFEVGKSIATWQSITSDCFGPFDLATFRAAGELRGLHADYATYFQLRLTQHLDYLVAKKFFSKTQRRKIIAAIKSHEALLTLDRGCLVHKDLALWNILGSPSHIAAFIDYDDAVSGDPLDDLSLLACFHNAVFLNHAFDGYLSIQTLPDNHRARFWLHLLRNLIVKAVIRVGSGYFDRDDRFYLIAPGGDGIILKQQTEERIAIALQGLSTEADLSILDAYCTLP